MDGGGPVADAVKIGASPCQRGGVVLGLRMVA
jgi:hypothetical protein